MSKLTETGHTPGPWRLSVDSQLHGEYTIYVGDGTRDMADAIIAEVAGGLGVYSDGCCESEANAEFIVRACNAHEDMLAALELAAPCLDSFLNGQGAVATDELDAALTAVSAAIAKAKGE